MNSLPLIFCLMLPQNKANAGDPVAGLGQCAIVLTDGWSSQRGEMFLLERKNSAAWRLHRSKIKVRLGRSGLAWGRGLLDTKQLSGPEKREGDDRAPAGVFRLRSVFGRARASAAPIRMPYLQISKNLVAVDDPKSRYYNQLVDKSKIKQPDWRSAEEMFELDPYEWGVVVEHNMPAKAGAGSCIFLHTWKSPATATSGCTAMAKKDLLDLIPWLDPGRAPLLVQLPRPAYDKLRQQWNLPAL